MAVTSVSLLHTGQSSESALKQRSYTSVYQVQVSSATDSPTLVENDFRIPFLGAFYASDPFAICVSRTATRVESTRLVWTVAVRYETQDREDDDKKDDNGEESDDPFDWRDKWEFTASRETVPVEQARMLTEGVEVWPFGTYRKPCNAAGDVFDPPLEKPSTIRVLRITKILRAYPTWADKYEDSINNDTFTIRKPGLILKVLPFTAKLEPINASLDYHQPRQGQEIAFVRAIIELTIKKDNWHFFPLNHGFNRRQIYRDVTDNGNTLVRIAPGAGEELLDPKKAPTTAIKDRDGQEVRVPVLLDKQGQPLAIGQEPIHFRCAGYEEYPFAPLRL